MRRAHRQHGGPKRQRGGPKRQRGGPNDDTEGPSTMRRPRLRCVTKTSDDESHRSFHYSLCFGADNTEHPTTTRRPTGPSNDDVDGPVTWQQPNSVANSPTMRRRTYRRSEGCIEEVEGASMRRRTHRRRRTLRQGEGHIDEVEHPTN